MKRRILASVQKLSDRDCADAAVDELRDAAEQLDGEQFALLLHTLTEGLGNPHYAKMAFTRRTNAPLVELHGLHALRGEAKVEAKAEEKESDAGAVVAGAAVNDPM